MIITLGDCIQLMGEVGTKSVDLTCTDIPYGVVNRDSNGLRSFDKGNADPWSIDMDNLLDQLCRVTKGSIYMFCSTEQVSHIRSGLVSRGMSTRLIIWEKTNPSPVNGQYIWLSGVECCVFGKFPKATFNEHCKNTVLRYPCGRNKLHPTQKPLELIEYLIKVSSNPGDVVFDPFMGSGTTGVAAIKNDRDFIGFELDKEYFEIAKERLYGRRV